MTSDSFRPRSGDPFELHRAAPEAWEHCKSLWLTVGHGFWTARSRWTEPRWRQHLSEAAHSFWIARERGCDVGFFELITQRRSVKLEGFGLLPQFRGLGRGGALLTVATAIALNSGTSYAWLHTATDDHPSALPNYLARGYWIHRERALANPYVRPRV